MLNIVLFEPEIPPNTGNIIRTCLAVNAKLHIIKPISFDLDPKYLSRPAAGRLISDIQHEIHNSYEDFYKKYKNKNIFYITRYGENVYSNVDFKKVYKNDGEVWLMFGKESTGIDKEILQTNLKNCLRIPMSETTRSINLANSVCVLSYEVMRQLNFASLSIYEVQKGKDYLRKLK